MDSVEIDAVKLEPEDVAAVENLSAAADTTDDSTDEDDAQASIHLVSLLPVI